MSSVQIALVVARAENGIIGRGGDLPWRMKSDLRWFKKVTLGKPVIMGRKTYESIGRPLPGRTNIVITRQKDYKAAGIEAVPSLDAALARAKEIALESGTAEVCVIGGGEIYKEALPKAHRLYLTTVEADIDGDTEFPPLDGADWTVAKMGTIPKSDTDEHNARMEVWQRKDAKPI